jgi:uncharacterized protein (DUF1800 family)
LLDRSYVQSHGFAVALMKSCRSAIVRLARFYFYSPLLLAALCAASDTTAQLIDSGGNGIADIWEIKFDAASLPPEEDSDGDGVKNWQESVAGTNPLDSNSVPRIAPGSYAGPAFSVTFPSVVGAVYELQSAPSPAGTNWQSESSVTAASTTTMLTGNANEDVKFFRVAVPGGGLGTNSAPKIFAFSLVPPAFTMAFPGVAGKYYELQSVSTFTDTNWLSETGVVARVTTSLTLSSPARPSEKYFRVAISDVDTDGDGISDWEEYQIGTDPLVAASNGQLDTNGVPVNDHDYAVEKLSAQNVVTILATDATATQPAPGQSPIGFGSYTVRRGGFPLNSITINLALAAPAPGLATENVDHEYVTRPVTLPAGASSVDIDLIPKANTNLTAPVVAMLKELPGAGYTVGMGSNASVVIYPSTTPTGTGLLGAYYTNSSTTYSNALNFNSTNLLLTRVDPVIDFTWGTSNSVPITNNGRYTVRWTGQVQPQYSETYYFVAKSDDSSKLWVNDQLLVDFWTTQGLVSKTNTIALQGGVRYNIKVEYLSYSPNPPRAQLAWFSDSQPYQIIPANRLYATTNSPSQVTSALAAVGFLGQPFSFTATGANSPNLYTASGLPPGLGFNSTNGVISGIPSLAGLFQASLTASNSIGLGASIVDITIFDTGSAVTREIWTNVSGTTIANIPVWTNAPISGPLGALQGITDYGDNYAERIRGYLTAPATGNYYFWLAGSDAAELWISNDDEPANKVRRAWVTPGGTAPLQFNLQPNQKSPWLALVAGQKYYIEILHKAGAGAGDNWAVAWLQDPTGTNAVPGPIVPGYVLSPHFDQPPAFIPGTLYGANMLAQNGIVSSGVGSATLRLSADEKTAVIKFSYSGLTSPVIAKHIHADAYQNKNSQGLIVCDFDEPTDAVLQSDGSYLWSIHQVGNLTPADLVEIIKGDKAYINVHTAVNAPGEINGHFTPAVGSQAFTPPPPPPAWTDDHTSASAAARFLIQSTFGPNATEIATVQALGYQGWIDNQFSVPISRHLTNVLANTSSDPTTPYSGNLTFNTWWQQSVTAPDQLRQRVAFALSEILVVSESGVLQDRATALSSYYDALLENSFGNFRDLLEAVTLTPAMGLYLDMRRNDKGDIALGTHPNENYAREILQLFSIGLNRTWPDGTLVMSSKGELVPTYTQDEILGFARVFTGWNYYQTPTNAGRLSFNWSASANYTNPMVLVPTHHELGTKRMLDNVILPPAFGSQADPLSVDFDNYGLQDLEKSHDSIFNNQNVGPFICRQLIQRLVTSHPSRDYVYRVVQKFNDNGSGVRGDMKAVIKAILLDYEARSTTAAALPTFGKQREPLCRVTATARAFPAPPNVPGTYSQSGNQTITVTTSSPHRMNNNDDPFLTFTDPSTKPKPPDQGYNVTVTSPTSFNFPAPGTVTFTYQQIGTALYVTNSNHKLSVGQPVFLIFTSGGAIGGSNMIVSVPTTSIFSFTTSDSANRTGSGYFPKITGGGYLQNSNIVTFSLPLEHGLNVGDPVFVNFNASPSPPDEVYPVDSVPDATHFAITVTNTANNRTQNGQTILPLLTPAINRSGTVVVRFNNWNMNTTDNPPTGTIYSLLQTPLNSPTVFNYFFPDYKFPGPLASAGLTTPEFQLTSDTGVMLQMNFLANGILNNSANTNGLTSFNNNNGAITLDIGPWMTPANTSAAGIPGLVDSFNSVLCGGQLSAAAKTSIVNYVTNTSNFSYTTPTPTATQMRDRVRAVLHLIVTSPDFTIQR